MEGGVRTFLSYGSCNTTRGDHLKWRSSFLNGLTNARVKGRYRKVLRWQREGAGAGGGDLRQTALPPSPSFSHCIVKRGLGRETTVARVIDWGESIMFDHKKHSATYGWPQRRRHDDRAGQTHTTATFACRTEGRGPGIQAPISKNPKRALLYSSLLQIKSWRLRWEYQWHLLRSALRSRLGRGRTPIYHPKIFKPATTACLEKVSIHLNCLETLQKKRRLEKCVRHLPMSKHFSFFPFA